MFPTEADRRDNKKAMREGSIRDLLIIQTWIRCTPHQRIDDNISDPHTTHNPESNRTK